MERLTEFLAEAREEFDEAFNWYAKRSHDAAIGFAVAIDAALDRILNDANCFPRTDAGCQYCRLERYPYCVIYHRAKGGVAVIAIAHAKRRPGYWRSRV